MIDKIDTAEDLLNWMRENAPVRWGMANREKRHFDKMPFTVEGDCIHVFDSNMKYSALNEAMSIFFSRRIKPTLLMISADVKGEILADPYLRGKISIYEANNHKIVTTFYGIPLAVAQDDDMWLLDASKWPPNKGGFIRIAWQHETLEETIARFKAEGKVIEGGK